MNRVFTNQTAMTKDKIFNWRFCLCCGFFIWFIVNLLQGIFTEIQEDEAYYHLFGEHLDWGYFDHPPMVALMTFLSSKLFSGTLGVRFFTIVVSCLSLFVIWKIASFNRLPQCDSPTLNNSKLSTLNSQLLFFILAFSVPMFNIYGFVTTPDVGLILFSALFLLVYQRYLSAPSWPRAMLMGALMACMVYSKYHAFLLLGLIVLSNFRLLKDGKFYVACLVALALLMPHILWQVNNDFPSFRYHLSGRSEPFRWSYFLEYLPNQLLIFNPFTFGAVVYVLILDCFVVPPRNDEQPKTASSGLLAMTDNQKTAPSGLLAMTDNQNEGGNVIASKAKQSKEKAPQERFERGLRFILIGFFFFFWLMAFRGHVEPHWTIVCVVPAVVMVYRKALVDAKLRKYIHRFVLPSLLLVVAFRIVLLTPLAEPFGFNGKEKHYKAIAQVAGDAPVVFQGSFQKPSLYHYFTGKECSTLKAYYDRKTQFDLWQFDTAWTGKPVFVGGPVVGRSEEYLINKVELEGYLAPRFQSGNRLVTDFRMAPSGDGQHSPLRHGDTLQMGFSVRNPYPYSIDFQDNDLDMHLLVLFADLNEALLCQYDALPPLQPGQTYEGQLKAVVSESIAPGTHRATLAIGDRIAIYATSGKTVEMHIGAE